MASIAVIFPSAIVNWSTISSRPRGATTTPTAPLTRAGRAALAPPTAARFATAAAPRTSADMPGRNAAAVSAHDNVRIEHRQQRLEVAAARGGQKRVDDFALTRRLTSSPCPRLAPDAGRGSRAAAPRRRFADDRRDLVEWHARTCRGERTRDAPRAPAFRGRRAARARPNRRAAFPARRRPPPRAARPVPAPSDRSAPRAAPYASAACPDRRAPPPSSASRRGSRRRSVSARLSLSHASCTASSASLSEPSIR